ncbi:hypothetical protein FACS1894162_6800 [Bacteroidia bacterium]|nr:hypothetical protein FACS1894162_6800 [Bacteroidia bacterium]
MQENHPFDLQEIMDLPKAVQEPLAVFRSATHLGSYVIMTELEHRTNNFVVALQTYRKKNRIEINDIRSIHYRTSNLHMANWIDEDLLEYVDKFKMLNWLSKQRSNSAEVRQPVNQYFNNYSKQQSNSADVRQLFERTTKIVQNFENTKL